MKITLVVHGIEKNVWLEEFARTSVAFALWHHRADVRHAFVHVDAAGGPGGGFSRCGIAAETELGVIRAGATGSDACEAIREASLVLEVAMFEGLARGSDALANPLAA